MNIFLIKVKKPIYLELALFLFLSYNVMAQDKSEAIYKVAKQAQNSDNKGDAVIEIASNFLGRPYSAGTLEQNGNERLIINLKEFDCSTLVETCLAIVNSTDYESFKKELTKIRYRNGKLDGYGSRLHYLTDWLAANQENKTLKLETKNIGGEIYSKQVDFISKHWNKYPRASTEKIRKEIVLSEKSINKYKFYYIPKKELPEIENQIQNGDIIAITTSIAGLDCSHQGFAIIKEGKLHLLHASTSKKKVIISEETLYNYLIKNPLQTGIMIGRL